jgi:hypothetical protein
VTGWSDLAMVYSTGYYSVPAYPFSLLRPPPLYSSGHGEVVGDGVEPLLL